MGRRWQCTQTPKGPRGTRGGAGGALCPVTRPLRVGPQTTGPGLFLRHCPKFQEGASRPLRTKTPAPPSPTSRFCVDRLWRTVNSYPNSDCMVRSAHCHAKWGAPRNQEYFVGGSIIEPAPPARQRGGAGGWAWVSSRARWVRCVRSSRCALRCALFGVASATGAV